MTDTLKPDQGLSSSYVEVQRSQEFLDLRSRFRRFVFPVTGLFLGWYFLYVLLAAFAPAFMSHKLVGNLNVGLFLVRQHVRHHDGLCALGRQAVRPDRGQASRRD